MAAPLIFSALCQCYLTASVGMPYLSTPPAGTWWEPDAPKTFHQHGLASSIGVRGEWWSIEYAQLGTITSAAEACAAADPATCHQAIAPMSMSHWYGTQHPHGAWAAFEPHYGPVFAQIGGGVYRPGFSMHIPDYPAVPGNYICPGPGCDVGNNHWAPSWLAGVGVRYQRVDIVANVRRVEAKGPEKNCDDFHGLSRHAAVVSVRFSF